MEAVVGSGGAALAHPAYRGFGSVHCRSRGIHGLVVPAASQRHCRLTAPKEPKPRGKRQAGAQRLACRFPRTEGEANAMGNLGGMELVVLGGFLLVIAIFVTAIIRTLKR